jgi:acetyltransferase-like isoleucine patch superfamily enzyme/dTDP-4-dehydrorhamnose 3,5-epimerase-like enzyme
MSNPTSVPPGVFRHERSLCESTKIGEGTRVWAFAHVLPGARIGCDCNICDHVFIENDVIVGDRVTIKCGVHLWDGLRVADDVFIGPNASFANDRYPRSKQHPRPPLETWIERGASIGGGAVVLPGLRIGARAIVGAGAVVTQNVPSKAIVLGNPAQIVGYVDAVRQPAERRAPAVSEPAGAVTPTSVTGVTLHRMELAVDLRGTLSAGEFPKHLPFVPKRYFLVFDVPRKDVRGEHSHRTLHQLLVCARGSLHVVVDDGRASEEIVLDRPDVGLYVPPLVWAVQYQYSSDAVLLVLASDPYEPSDYIRDYDEFLAAIRR